MNAKLTLKNENVLKPVKDTFTAGIVGRDQVTLIIHKDESNGERVELKAVGCLPFLRQVAGLRDRLVGPRSRWEVPQGSDHSAILLREAILKARGEWEFPYKDEELCHCRAVATQIVDAAIVCGAKTTDEIARLTSAGSACGTCRSDSQKILDYRRKATS